MSGPWSSPERSIRDWVRHPRATFGEWREPRPLGGAVLLLLGGVMIGYIPAQFTSELLFIGGTFTVIGLVFAVAVAFCGIAALAKPRFSTVFGTLGIVFSTLSLFGALGGLLIGMVVGTAGGILCYAWEPPEGYETASLAEASGFIWQEAGGFVWQDSRGFVWQTDENRQVAADGAAETADETPADDEIGLDLVPGDDDGLDEDAALGADDGAAGFGDLDTTGGDTADEPETEGTGTDADGTECDDADDGDDGNGNGDDDEDDTAIETGFEFDGELDSHDRFDL